MVKKMPRKSKDGQPFDQSAYIAEWAKQNMGTVKASYKKDFVQEFKASCKELGITQSEVFRKAMQNVIDEYQKPKEQ